MWFYQMWILYHELTIVSLQREVLYGSIRAIRIYSNMLSCLLLVFRLSAMTLTIEIKQIGGS